MSLVSFFPAKRLLSAGEFIGEILVVRGLRDYDFQFWLVF